LEADLKLVRQAEAENRIIPIDQSRFNSFSDSISELQTRVREMQVSQELRGKFISQPETEQQSSGTVDRTLEEINKLELEGVPTVRQP
jgi:hypothetical protein